MDITSKVATSCTRNAVQFLDLANAPAYTQERVGEDVEDAHPDHAGEQCIK